LRKVRKKNYISKFTKAVWNEPAENDSIPGLFDETEGVKIACTY
jgi:hypothetical protein